jgi:D-glycero-D-manno-heptose 1,7-bisphosphate phosphatase
MRAVFLDRDGVLNEAFVRNGKVYSPDTIEEMIIRPDVAPALARLRAQGFRLVVATNQPDIARGRLTRAQVDAMNAYLRSKLPLDAIEVCAHDDVDHCDCRKPGAGLLLRAAERDGITLDESFMVGDRVRDIEAGRRAHCRTILIGDSYGEPFTTQPDAKFATLGEAADWILQQPVKARD